MYIFLESYAENTRWQNFSKSSKVLIVMDRVELFIIEQRRKNKEGPSKNFIRVDTKNMQQTTCNLTLLLSLNRNL